MKLVLTDKAKTDLLRIHWYLAQRSSRATDAVMRRINDKLNNLSRFPFIGRMRPSLGLRVRSVVAGTYLIFYFVADNQIMILRVIDGRMDIDEEFRR